MSDMFVPISSGSAIKRNETGEEVYNSISCTDLVFPKHKATVKNQLHLPC